LVYVDDIIIISEIVGMILKHMKESYSYLLKDIGEPKSYLGSDIGKKIGVLGDTWFFSPEESLRSLKTMFGQSTNNSPAPTTFRPELGNSTFLGTYEAQLYQSYIGLLRFSVELGRIDITHVTATLSKFMINPREGHLKAF